MPDEVIQHIATLLHEPRDLHSFATTDCGIAAVLAEHRLQANLALQAEKIQSLSDAQDLLGAILQIRPSLRSMPLLAVVHKLPAVPDVDRRVVVDMIFTVLGSLPAAQREDWLVELGSNLWVFPEVDRLAVFVNISAAIEQLPAQRCAEVLSMLAPCLGHLPQDDQPQACRRILAALGHVCSAEGLKPLQKLIARVRSLPSEARAGALAGILAQAERLPANHQAVLLEAAATSALSFLPVGKRLKAFLAILTVLAQLPAKHWTEPLSALLGTSWSLETLDRPNAVKKVFQVLEQQPAQHRTELQATIEPFMPLWRRVD